MLLQNIMSAKMKKGIIFLGGVLAIVAAILIGIKLYRIHDRDQCGILLAFDDYSALSWEEYFDLFDQYDANVTFFITATEPTDFCYNALERGHEIAYHAAWHDDLTTLSEEEVYQEAIAPIELFQERGITLTTFAYPFGAHNDELDEVLLDHYNVLRGAFELEINGKHQLRKGFVESLSIDNINYDSQEVFEEKIIQILTALKEGKGRVVSLYSHAIGDGNWCISDARLTFLLKTAKEMGIQFYTFQELQNW